MTSGISTLGLQASTISILQSQATQLDNLNQQLASGVQNSSLSGYSPVDALDLMNYQNSISQRQAYISSINTVQARLSVYSTSMSDMETVTQAAQTLAAENTSYNASTASEIGSQVSNYLSEIQDDLNQQVDGRYIYAGARYTTAPVGNLSNLSGTVSTSFTPTTSPTLPNYDSEYVSGLTATTSGQDVTFNSTSPTVTTPQAASVTVNGTVYTYTIQSGDTTSDVAAGLATLVSAQIPGTTSSGGTLTVGPTGTVTAAGGNANTSSYTLDSASIDSGYSVTYGVSSNAPAFQQLIAGLQLMQQASQSTDATTYQTEMTSAATLLSTALTGIQTLNTGVADNTSVMSQEASTQNVDISNLQDQVSAIDGVNSATVSTEIAALQAQLEASYTATGDILKLSLVNYL